jgi:uncharacterized Zn finger protein
MSQGNDKQCPTCGSKEHRTTRLVTIDTTHHQIAEMIFVCTVCGTLFDPQYIKKIGWLNRLIRWLSK